MNEVIISTESRFQINRQSIKEAIEKILKEKKVSSNCSVEVTIVGDRKMRWLNNKYRKVDQTTNVLSFPLEDGSTKREKSHGFVSPPDNVLRLGSIVVSYPRAVSEAAKDNCLVDDKIAYLIEHGMLHLLGYHHPEN